MIPKSHADRLEELREEGYISAWEPVDAVNYDEIIDAEPYMVDEKGHRAYRVWMS